MWCPTSIGQGEDAARSALYLLSSYLPKKYVSFLTKDALTSLGSPARGQDHESLLVALISWGQSDQVAAIITSKATQGFAELEVLMGGEHAVPLKDGGRKRGGLGNRSKCNGQLDVGVEGSSGCVQGSVAMDMLIWMMAHPYCMGEMKQAKQFWELTSILKTSMVSSEHYAAPFWRHVRYMYIFGDRLGSLCTCLEQGWI